MAFFEEMESPYVPYLRTHLHQLAASISAASCNEECRDEVAALRLKMATVTAILAVGAASVTIPLVGRQRRGDRMFVLAKAFAAGVILAMNFWRK